MSIETVRDAIVATVSQQLPDLKTCAAHPGRFSEAELTRIAFKTPSVHIAALATGQQIMSGSEHHASIAWCAYVTAAETPDATRDLLAIRLVNALLQIIDDNDWDSDDVVEKPEQIKSQNLFSANIDSKGVAMWAVTWQQIIRLGDSTDYTALNEFLRAIGDTVNDDGMTLIETHTELEGTGNE